MTSRRGVSLMEMLVTLALTGLIATALLGMLARFQALAQTQPLRIAFGDAVRLVHVVLRSELREVSQADIAAVSRDSIRLRVFRGVGITCAQSDGGVLVRYHGSRAPDPDKDSVLVVDADGERVVALTGAAAAASGCAPRSGEALQRWSLSGEYTRGALVLLFETGAYGLSSGAFRYRRGNSGRQPLTAEVLPASAHFVPILGTAEPPAPAQLTTLSVMLPEAALGSVRRRPGVGARITLANALPRVPE